MSGIPLDATSGVPRTLDPSAMTQQSSAQVPQLSPLPSSQQLQQMQQLQQLQLQQQQQQQQNIQSQSLANSDGQIVHHKVRVPLTFEFSPAQATSAIRKPLDKSLEEYLGQHPGDRVVVTGVKVLHTDNSLRQPLYLNLSVLNTKGNLHSNGASVDGKSFTFVIPDGKVSSYDKDHATLYSRTGTDITSSDFADNMQTDLESLKSVGVQPYTGQGGKFAATHIEVKKNANPALYDMVLASNGVDRFATGTPDDMGVALSKKHHQLMLDTYTNDDKSGYIKAGRISPEMHTATLSHLGAETENSQLLLKDLVKTASGLNSAGKKEMAGQTHRAFAELEYSLAVFTPNKKPDNQSS